jgi:hypothetical protein
MQTKTCKACRTVNEDFAIVCRNCGARIGDPPQPGQSETDGATLSAPPTTPAQPPAVGSDSGFGPPPPPGAMPPVPTPTEHPGVVPRKSNTGLVIGFVAALAVVVAVGIYFLTSGGSSLPDELAGHPRSESEIATQIEEMFQSFEVQGMSFDVALYGEGEPVAIMMLFKGLPDIATNVPSDAFFDGFATGFAQQQGLGIDPGAGVRASGNGADFLCVDVPAEALAAGGLGGFGNLGGFGSAQSGSFCVFKGDTIGMVMLFDGTGAAAAMPAVQEAYAQIA